MSDFYAQYDENAEAPITTEHLQQCRSRKTEMEQKNKWIFMAHIAIGIELFVLSMFMSALVGKDPAVEGPNKWFLGMTLAAMQIIFAGAVIGFGFWAAMKRRIPSYVLMGLFLGHMLYTLLAPYSYMEVFHVIVDILGIALNYLRLRLIDEHMWLQKQPGYPYFSEALLKPNEYELPKHITHRRPPSEDMDCVGAPTDHTAGTNAACPDLAVPSAEDVALADMTAPEIHIPEVKLPPPVRLTSAPPTELLEAPAQVPHTAVQQDVLQCSENATLADMTVPETRQTGGALPDPEEVKARLRRMAEEKRSAGAQE